MAAHGTICDQIVNSSKVVIILRTVRGRKNQRRGCIYKGSISNVWLYNNASASRCTIALYRNTYFTFCNEQWRAPRVSVPQQ